MGTNKPVLCLVGGPNGSGKSTQVETIYKSDQTMPQLYINADDIAKTQNMTNQDAADYAGWQRQQAIAARQSFTTETVMSRPDKLDLMRQAKAAGYEVQLIYVTTQDPTINLKRIQDRVEKGGHDVPPDKTVSRYDRSMALLPEAVGIADRARIYNNSFTNPVLIAEKSVERGIELYPQPEPSKWTQDKLKNLLGINPERDKRIQDITNHNPATIRTTPARQEYLNQAQNIVNENRRWPGPEADQKIIASMLTKGLSESAVKDALSAKSPEFAGLTQGMVLKNARQIVDQIAKQPEIAKTISKGFER